MKDKKFWTRYRWLLISTALMAVMAVTLVAMVLSELALFSIALIVFYVGSSLSIAWFAVSFHKH